MLCLYAPVAASATAITKLRQAAQWNIGVLENSLSGSAEVALGAQKMFIVKQAR